MYHEGATSASDIFNSSPLYFFRNKKVGKYISMHAKITYAPASLDPPVLSGKAAETSLSSPAITLDVMD